MTAPSDGDYPKVSAEFPSIARMYNYCLGGKDNFEVDRVTALAFIRRFPWGVNDARTHRQFLYRAVRFLARDAGIRQFLDLGSGLPTENNVHQVAQRFQPEARVVYVDKDPTVLAYARALLATDPGTTVIEADATRPKEIFDDPQARRLIDFSQPVAVLSLGVGHLVMDDATLDGALQAVREAIVPGSYVVFSQMCMPTQQAVDEHTRMVDEMAIAWRTRLPQQVTEYLRGLEPLDPGLVYVRDWRPDPTQPALPDVDEPLRPFLAEWGTEQQGGNFGGVLHKPRKP